eukprot:697634-Pelagomonas_calceolata.AAC.1
MVLTPLPGTKAALMLFLCALSQADPHKLILLRSLPKTGTFAQNRSSRNPNKNNKVTLHIILAGVAGTNYNDYSVKPLTNLGLTRQKAKSLGTPGGGVAERVTEESSRRRVRASRSMADNPPDPHELCFWLSPRLAVFSL